MTVKIGIEHLPLLTKLQDVLFTEPSAVKQQTAIELLMASHAGRMDQIGSDVVLDAMRKHAGQMLKNVEDFEAKFNDGYQYYSNTGSGWTVSTNPKADPAKRWKIVHPDFGTKYFREHDEILEYTVKNMMKIFEQTLGFKMPKDRK